MREIAHLVLVLGVICSLSAAALAYVRTSLAGRIEMQEDFYVRGPALERLFKQPAEGLLTEKLTVPVGDQTYPVFYLREAGEVTGLAVEAAGHGGYSGDIVIMIGLDPRDDRVLGVEIVSHSETPGVGAKVELASFRQQWTGLTLDQPVSLTSDGGGIDAITGATFSSRAMVDGTNQVVEMLRDHRQEILLLIEERSSGGAVSGGEG
ncbi:MAG: RnfABCDGE type electron transport complex subunit G [Candidatus Krumholzibacteria bacterium]|nr:RnfABCDGE type electron transport complex subunit G [Candidatus Krumholzibacteria bacterium]